MRNGDHIRRRAVPSFAAESKGPPDRSDGPSIAWRHRGGGRCDRDDYIALAVASAAFAAVSVAAASLTRAASLASAASLPNVPSPAVMLSVMVPMTSVLFMSVPRVLSVFVAVLSPRAAPPT